MSATGYGQTADLSRVAKAGDTMTGPLVLTGNPAMQSSAGAANGDVWTSDALGNGSWKPAGTGSGSLLAVNNLSDLSSAGLARSNMGLGSAALLSAAAVAQTANNLSDLASAGLSRSNLGLGGAAVLNVGTGAGTVAAGNSRLDQFQPPTSAVGWNAQKLTSLANGTALTDAVAFGQLPIVAGPAANMLLAWNFDPIAATANTTLSNGQLALMELQLPAGKVFTNLVAYVTNGATGGVSGQNFAALLDSGGNRVALTSDQTAAWASPGTKTMAVSGGPYTTPSAGSYYVVLLGNATGPAQFAAGSPSGQVANAGLGGAPWRFGNSGNGLTAVPASVNLSTMGQEFPYWVGMS